MGARAGVGGGDAGEEGQGVEDQEVSQASA